MAELKNLILEKKDGVARLTLDRPKHNVLNIEMMQSFNAVIEALLADTALKCLVICGAGKSFCAGVDVGEHKPDMVNEMISVFGRIFELLHTFEVPTIAAVHGACLGGGMELAIACDMVVASKKASFGQPEIKLGFLPPYAAIRLPQLIGPAKAIEICTSGKIYPAVQAAQIGFVSQVVEPDQFEGAVDQLVAEISGNSPLIIRLNKQGGQHPSRSAVFPGVKWRKRSIFEYPDED
jgi:cyclohexa-1,5-dienecarbonyl-CoA hydratase